MKSASFQKFNLANDMLETVNIVRNFDCNRVIAMSTKGKSTGKLFFVGEGSSRIFPSKHCIKVALQRGYRTARHTEGGVQAQSYDLTSWTVFGVSNSGRTAEVIGVFRKLHEAQHASGLYTLTAFPDTKLQSYADDGIVLKCGKEGAVAATKSVIEQALVCQALSEAVEGDVGNLASRCVDLASAIDEALSTIIPADIIAALVKSPVLYWAGPNDGVAEELTLKTNEITRKRSHYLEGTYAVHGVEEAMNKDEVLIWVDPAPENEAKFEEVLCKGVGVKIVAISTRATRFPTLRVKSVGDLSGYVALTMGWNLLMSCGVSLGIDVDKPERARKVGNEVVEQPPSSSSTNK